MNKNLLEVENLTMKFGGLTAIDDLSFSAKDNEITSITGPNGAGKTTVFNCLTGFYKFFYQVADRMLYEQREKLGIQKHWRRKFKIPKIYNKSDHKNLQKPCRRKQEPIRAKLMKT